MRSGYRCRYSIIILSRVFYTEISRRSLANSYMIRGSCSRREVSRCSPSRGYKGDMSYDCGIGAKNSQGFGMVAVLNAGRDR